MAGSLDAVERRLDWAWAHIEEVRAEVERLMEGEGPYRLTPELRSDGVTLYRATQTRPVPPDLSLEVADIIHNLRASLDNIIWAVAAGYGTPPENLDFPVFVDSTRFAARALPTLRRSRLPQDAIAVIERLQPYHVPHPEEHSLRLLNRRWNHDKHRTPVVACVVPAWGMFQVLEGDIETALAVGHPVENGLVVAWVRPKPGQPARFEEKLSLTLAFHEEGPLLGRLLPQCLIAAHHLVRDSALGQLRPFVT